MFMLWLQISWTICLFGAELCYTSQYVDFYDLNISMEDISHRYKLMMCALLLACICRRHDKGERPYSAGELRELTQIPPRIVNDLLYDLQQANLVCETTSDEKGELTRYLPAITPEHLSLGMMIDRLEAMGKWSITLPKSQLKTEYWRKAIAARTNYLKETREMKVRDLWKNQDE